MPAERPLERPLERPMPTSQPLRRLCGRWFGLRLRRRWRALRLGTSAGWPLPPVAPVRPIGRGVWVVAWRNYRPHRTAASCSDRPGRGVEILEHRGGGRCGLEHCGREHTGRRPPSARAGCFLAKMVKKTKKSALCPVPAAKYAIKIIVFEGRACASSNRVKRPSRRSLRCAPAQLTPTLWQNPSTQHVL